MFTGIIESEGTILELTKKGNDIALTISYDQKIFDDIRDGDSISVNGICLTIEQFSKDKVKFHLSMESISKVAKFTLDQKVNLETDNESSIDKKQEFEQITDEISDTQL